ncbi:uncharacterized protein Smp_201100 [Schistosoma mansoni]|uniref:uncharacterized protein n=1 Tax=Schistosoma mansoni TaxID=6183 RepID=UPI00022DC1EA|nr:uncharacterized protein Smp_201100 [Schistosoma mansoni]|eukprot:XP_018648980.1 uncharacterized protein Smp_201100 [Schistosoma mansoni]
MTDEFLFFSDSTCSMDLPCKPLACKIQSCLISKYSFLSLNLSYVLFLQFD